MVSVLNKSDKVVLLCSVVLTNEKLFRPEHIPGSRFLYAILWTLTLEYDRNKKPR